MKMAKKCIRIYVLCTERKFVDRHLPIHEKHTINAKNGKSSKSIRKEGEE